MKAKIKSLKMFNEVFGWMLQQENSKYSNPILRAYRLGLLFLIVPMFSSAKKNDLWIIGSRIYLQDINFQKCTLISTPRDYKKLKKIPKYFRQMYLCYGLIYLSWRAKSGFILKIAYNIIERKIVKDNPKGIIINCTKDPFNRLVSLAARNNEIKTACVQHGLMSPNIHDDLNEDDLVDFYYALNKNQSKIISRKINSCKIRLLSDSYVNTNTNTRTRQGHAPIKNICLIGEDWERYNEYTKKELIISTYKKLISVAASSIPGVNFYYRPHPSEVNFLAIDKLIPFSRFDIDSFDLFIGFSSTFLWDMAVKKKICLQIFSESISELNFDSECICRAIQLGDKCLDDVLSFIKAPQMKYNVDRLEPSKIVIFE
jgi:hypothetical protein